MSTSTTYSEALADKPVNSATRVATASFIGTAIEFYDFYVYATAAALVIGPVFFPQTSGTAQMLSAFLTFGIHQLYALPFDHATHHMNRPAIRQQGR